MIIPLLIITIIGLIGLIFFLITKISDITDVIEDVTQENIELANQVDRLQIRLQLRDFKIDLLEKNK